MAGNRGEGENAGFVRWSSSFFPGLELIARGAHVHRYRYHVHDPLEITWVLSGNGNLAYRNQLWGLGTGDAFLVAPRAPHAGGVRGDSPFSFVTLHVPEALLPDIAARSGLDPAALPSVATRSGVRGLLETLLERLQAAPSPGGQIDALAGTLRAYISADGATVLPRPGYETHPAVSRARAILDEAYEEPIAVSELASAVRLHERYLISLFKSATGIPPHQYLLARRLEHARCMLGTEQPLSAVAAAAGFTDQSHLTRHFKRTFGLTPGAYQRTSSTTSL